MSSRQGYRISEIGEIPEEWEVVKLENKYVSETLKAGGTPLRTKKEYYENGTIPFVRIEDMTKNQKYLTNTELKITDLGLRNSSAWMVPSNSILFSMYASFGEVVINAIPVATNQAIIAIRPSKDFNLEYLYYVLSSLKPRLNRFLRETTQKNLNAGIVKDLTIPLIPLPEQQKIASILSTVDAAIQKTDEIMAKTQQLKKGLMQQLLTNGIGHTKFKQTEIGEIPEEWKIIKLGKVTTIRYGLGQPPEQDENGIPMIRATNIKRGKILDADLLRVKPSALPESRDVFLHSRDIIIVRSGVYTGDIGRVTQRFEGAVAGYDLIVSPSEEVDTAFLTNYLLSPQVQSCFFQLKFRAAQSHLNTHQVSNTLIALPPLSEQQKIGSLLLTTDEMVEMDEARRRELEQLKKGLMQVLLTGKVRVKVN